MAEKNIAAADVRTLLQTVAQMLRTAHHLTPEAQALLADLLEELGKSFGSSAPPSGDATRLAERASHLVQAVHEEKHAGILEAANDRLERAILAVEAGAPGVASIARRLAEMLSDVGI